VLAPLAVGPVAGVAAIDPVRSLAGRWAGNGTVEPARGPAESFRCVVTYVETGQASELRQNVRCASESYRLETATHLRFVDGKVSGRWEDKINALDGQVTGAVTASGFDVRLAGRFFTASMVVEGSGCSQSITVVPERADHIRRLSASLAKC
jgi:hypothetical protein